jgi:hypothetical protein
MKIFDLRLLLLWRQRYVELPGDKARGWYLDDLVVTP